MKRKRVSSQKPRIKLGKSWISDDSLSYIIAEIGSNHNRSYEKALKLIDVAKRAGANAVKFQTFRAETLYSRYAPRLKEMKSRSYSKEKPFDLIKRIEMPWEWHEGLKKYCEKIGIDFCSTPFDLNAVDLLERINVAFYKISSSEIDDIFLLKKIAGTGKSIIVSTGKSDLKDVRRTFNYLCRHGARSIALLHCISQYPSRHEDTCLKAMVTLKNAFNVVVGFSDHTLDEVSALGAVSLGAKIIEKHITLDKKLPGPDHSFALDPEEFLKFVLSIRSLEKALGSSVKTVRDSERESKLLANRSIHASKDIPKGAVIRKNMVCIKRPALGISPWSIANVLGKKAVKHIRSDQWITMDLIR